MPGIEVREHFFEDEGRIPNNPMLPLLVYPRALPAGAGRGHPLSLRL